MSRFTAPPCTHPMLCHITQSNFIQHNVKPCPITPHHTTLCHMTSRFMTPAPRHRTPGNITPYNTTSPHVTSHYATSRNVSRSAIITSFNGMLRHATPNHTRLRYMIPYHATSLVTTPDYGTVRPSKLYDRRLHHTARHQAPPNHIIARNASRTSRHATSRHAITCHSSFWSFTHHFTSYLPPLMINTIAVWVWSVLMTNDPGTNSPLNYLKI